MLLSPKILTVVSVLLLASCAQSEQCNGVDCGESDADVDVGDPSNGSVSDPGGSGGEADPSDADSQVCDAIGIH